MHRRLIQMKSCPRNPAREMGGRKAEERTAGSRNTWCADVCRARSWVGSGTMCPPDPECLRV